MDKGSSSAYDLALAFIRAADTLRILQQVHREAPPSLVELMVKTREEYDKARNPDGPVNHHIVLVRVTGSYYRAKCSCGKFRSSPMLAGAARSTGMDHVLRRTH